MVVSIGAGHFEPNQMRGFASQRGGKPIPASGAWADLRIGNSAILRVFALRGDRGRSSHKAMTSLRANAMTAAS